MSTKYGYTLEEKKKLLEIVSDQMRGFEDKPISIYDWKYITEKYNRNFPRKQRTYEAIRRRYYRLGEKEGEQIIRQCKKPKEKEVIHESIMEFLNNSYFDVGNEKESKKQVDFDLWDGNEMDNETTKEQEQEQEQEQEGEGSKTTKEYDKNKKLNSLIIETQKERCIVGNVNANFENIVDPKKKSIDVVCVNIGIENELSDLKDYTHSLEQRIVFLEKTISVLLVEKNIGS